MDPIVTLLSLAQDHPWILYAFLAVYAIGFLGSHVLRIIYPEPKDRTERVNNLMKLFDAMNLFFGTQSKEIGRKRQNADNTKS